MTVSIRDPRSTGARPVDSPRDHRPEDRVAGVEDWVLGELMQLVLGAAAASAPPPSASSREEGGMAAELLEMCMVLLEHPIVQKRLHGLDGLMDDVVLRPWRFAVLPAPAPIVERRIAVACRSVVGAAVAGAGIATVDAGIDTARIAEPARRVLVPWIAAHGPPTGSSGWRRLPVGTWLRDGTREPVLAVIGRDRLSATELPHAAEGSVEERVSQRSRAARDLQPVRPETRAVPVGTM